jgi:multisubunit Na+/H+ antiporter MnhG subunit
MPPAGPLLIAIAGLLWWRRDARVGFALCAVGVAILWLISTPFVADALARSAESYPALDPFHLTADQAKAREAESATTRPRWVRIRRASPAICV